MIRFGVFTDAHYALGRQYGTRFCDLSLRKLEACLETFVKHDVAFMVNIGDLIDGTHDPRIDEQNLSRVAATLDRAGLPVHHILGNHDLESMSKREVAGILGIRDERTWYSIEREGTRMLLLDASFRADGTPYDSGNYTWTDAGIPPDEVDWIAGEIQRARGRRMLVFVHQNLDDRDQNGSRDPHVISNAAEVRSILDQAGRDVVVFQGHYHPGLVRTAGRVTYVTIEAMCEGNAADDNTCAVVTVTDDEVRIDGFGRQQSYVLR